MVARLGEQRRIVGRIGDLGARRQVADDLRRFREHGEDQRLGIRVGKRAVGIAGGNARGSVKGHAEAGFVERVARFAPQCAVRPRSEPTYDS